MHTQQHYPAIRKRRLRQAPWIRTLTQEQQLHACDLIWPVFIHDSDQQKTPIDALPGVDRLNVEGLLAMAKRAISLGIGALALFPAIHPTHKDAQGREALNPKGLIPQAIATLKKAYPQLGIIADIALDPYTDHGHDGIVVQGRIANDATVAILCDMALLLAESGCDVLAPSDMMDGRIGAIRHALETGGKQDTIILSYAAKYASAFYGPFRAAVGSANHLQSKSKETYQMHCSNSDEALHEVSMDIAEGADMVMIKPGMPYLDIIHRVKQTFAVPTLAYQVSGEYSMLMHYAKATEQDPAIVFQESLLAFKRAGADAIFTYAAPLIAKAIAAGHAK